MAVLSSNGEILQSPEEIGQNYTGIGGAGIGTGTPLNYGFILASNKVFSNLFTTSQSVTLDINPDSISQDEEAATNIIKTQNSGRYIERRGQVGKMLSITGTTGYNPTQKVPTAIRTAMPGSSIIELEGPDSGLARFLKLRNLFRQYWNTFADPNQVGNRASTFLIWVNEKDGENWIVEPLRFRMMRQSPRNKFTYNYEITFETVAPVEGALLTPSEPVTLFQKVNNLAATVQSYANQITAYAEIVTGAITAIGNIEALAADVIRQAVSDVVSICNQVSEGLNAIANGTKEIIEIPDLIKGNVDEVATSFMGAWTNLMSVGDTIDADSGTTGAAIPFAVYQSLNSVAEIMAVLSGRSELYNQSFADTWEATLENYDPSYGFGGYNQTLLKSLTENGVREGAIYPGEDVVKIALRELGDAERFQDIIVLNNLKPPYISPSQASRLANTLAPGDAILIPATPSGASANVPISTTIYNDPTLTTNVLSSGSGTVQVNNNGSTFRTNQWAGFTINVISGTGIGQTAKVISNTVDTLTLDTTWGVNPDTTSVINIELVRITATPPIKSSDMQSLGIDVQLFDNDIALNASGDMALVAGATNMTQACSIKMDTKPGTLPLQPQFGLGFDVGIRATPENIMNYKLAVRQTLLADARISSIASMTVQNINDALYMTGSVNLAGVAQPLAINNLGAG